MQPPQRVRNFRLLPASKVSGWRELFCWNVVQHVMSTIENESSSFVKSAYTILQPLFLSLYFWLSRYIYISLSLSLSLQHISSVKTMKVHLSPLLVLTVYKTSSIVFYLQLRFRTRDAMSKYTVRQSVIYLTWLKHLLIASSLTPSIYNKNYYTDLKLFRPLGGTYAEITLPRWWRSP